MAMDPKDYVGQTGGTGAPGNPGTTPRLTLVKGNRQSPEELHEQVRNERINMFIGITGAAGLPGDIKVNDKGEVTSPISDEVEARFLQCIGGTGRTARPIFPGSCRGCGESS